ncbi:MAG: glycine zipper 2TM domain-containing protein [Waddliaceae bacterium]|jgi:outer membrane lipoprotein SlyB|nr:glycine zipper 2TM domain-containing protein [Waddliaceae bacterium]MBT3579538.1 glycine zipper 2TM domain-containing protein [Waddliaceae bacterium]MBT4445010.1 glycine zipper 2TM domain-containing protein [Waddliaceae bacterium]MBT6928651.1 glycine zipper 2TM domain-containing protein [Waddliaceae bacterium]MBT7265189.1 glycine zipper 2TM domain-containing protein [Waddliaceae bacterium]
MKKYLAVGLLSAVALVFCSGCETRQQTGTLTGAAIGAGTGALIDDGEGALIGGAIGALVGSIIGSELDDQERMILENRNPQTLSRLDNQQQLSVYDIKALSDANVSDKIIIDHIYASKSVFNLSTNDIIKLNEWEISEAVVDAMIRTGY